MSMQSILSASQSMNRMQTMQSARAQMQSSADILRIQSKQDGGNEKKIADADALEKKSNNLMSDLMDEINDVNETLKPDEEAEAQEKKEAERAEKAKREDSVTLSNIAAGHRENSPAPQPATGEAVTYDASGSSTPSESAKSAPTLEVTA